MPKPGEHKTVQSRILEYAEAIGWTIVSLEQAEQRRGLDPQITQISTDPDSGKNNLRTSAQSAVNKRADGKGLSLFFDDEELRERDLVLICYDNPGRNILEATKEQALADIPRWEN